MRYLPSFRLDGRGAIVTGAGKGLGRHISLALAEAGADLALVGRTEAALCSIAAEIKQMGRRAFVIAGDVTDIAETRRIASAAATCLDGIDILVNNAGTNVQQPFLEVTPEAWEEITRLNLTGAFFMAQSAARCMVEKGVKGRIINVASQMAEVGFFKRSVYCATKAGMVGFTRAMAVELAHYGIRVNALGPTFIDSPLARRMFEDQSIADDVLDRIPIGRLGTMAEVAAAVVFLASDGADLVTGHHLLMDGGWTAW